LEEAPVFEFENQPTHSLPLKSMPKKGTKIKSMPKRDIQIPPVEMTNLLDKWCIRIKLRSSMRNKITC
jgi:hypothetical protein